MDSFRKIFLIGFVFGGLALFAADEINIQLPKETKGANFLRDGVLFFLSAIYDGDLPESESSQITLSRAKLPKGFNDFFDKETIEASTLYVSLKNEEAVKNLYLTSVSVPKTLAEFEKKTQFKKESKKIIEKSEVKGYTRILYRGETFSVAQTHLTQEGKEEAEVRETEVIRKREKGEQWDFFAYNKKGELALSSTFLTKTKSEVEGPTPVTCMACHYDSENRRFQQLPLFFKN